MIDEIKIFKKASNNIKISDQFVKQTENKNVQEKNDTKVDQKDLNLNIGVENIEDNPDAKLSLIKTEKTSTLPKLYKEIYTEEMKGNLKKVLFWWLWTTRSVMLHYEDYFDKKTLYIKINTILNQVKLKGEDEIATVKHLVTKHNFDEELLSKIDQ